MRRIQVTLEKIGHERYSVTAAIKYSNGGEWQHLGGTQIHSTGSEAIRYAKKQAKELALEFNAEKYEAVY